MEKTAAERIMEREIRVAYGPAPRTLLGPRLSETAWQMRGEEFLIRGEGDHYFHYRKSRGITVERGEAFDPSEESLWLNGSVYAAIASLNGLLPIHASAVAHDDRVFAFTGPAGAGKSTLVAALGRRGLPMFCDDTLVLDLSDPGRIVCLPGHKRLKLRPDVLDLTGAEPEEIVSRTVEKYYARPRAGDVAVALPLARLVFLEEAPEPTVVPITGADRFARLQDEHQTSRLFAAARSFGKIEHFDHLAHLARQIDMARFARPLERARFDECVAIAAQYVTNRGCD